SRQPQHLGQHEEHHKAAVDIHGDIARHRPRTGYRTLRRRGGRQYRRFMNGRQASPPGEIQTLSYSDYNGTAFLLTYSSTPVWSMKSEISTTRFTSCGPREK